MKPEPRIVLFSRAQPVVDAVLATTATLGIEVQVCAEPGAALARWSGAEIVLVGGDQAAALASAAPRKRSGVYLVGFDPAELGAWSMPLGAEVIPLPQGATWLSAVMSADPEASPPVVAVVGGAGGVGASTLAAGLALAAARRGLGAALVDIDPLGGGVDLLLGAERTPGWRWPRLLGARGEVGDVRAVLPQADGVSVVSMARGDGARAPSSESVQAVLGSLARHHDLVVLDTGRYPLGPARAHVPLAQPCLLVTGPDVRSVAAAGQTLRAMELDEPRLVVRTSSRVRVPPQVVADALGLPLWGVLPHEPRLVNAADAGEAPVVRSRWGRAVGVILDRVVAEVSDER